MAILYPEILERVEEREYRWSRRDVMLYALAVGMARDSLDARELPFAYEQGLRVMPSFASVAAPGAGARLLLGLDYAKVVDAERRIVLHRPLPATATVIARTRVSRIVDRGEGRGALFTRETILHEGGRALATIFATTFARGDGGFGGPLAEEREDEAAPPRERAADVSVTFATWPSQALLFRLCGDRNPLHADPEAARKAGFERPILHGMCTFGIACHAILKSVVDYRCEEIAELSARFVAPVFPGDRLRINLWREAADVRFEVEVEQRQSIVLRDGHALLREGAGGDG